MVMFLDVGTFLSAEVEVRKNMFDVDLKLWKQNGIG